MWFPPEEHPHFLRWLVKLEDTGADRVEASFQRTIFSEFYGRLMARWIAYVSGG